MSWKALVPILPFDLTTRIIMIIIRVQNDVVDIDYDYYVDIALC